MELFTGQPALHLHYLNPFVAQCARHVFSIQCSPHNATTTLRWLIDSAIIESECFTICGGNNVSIQLPGVFYYHLHTWTFDVFLNSTQTVPQLGWFRDINIPDLSPLWLVATSHWKLTLAFVGTVSSLLIISYVFGPAVAIYLLLTIGVVTLGVLRVMLNVLRIAIGMMDDIDRELRVMETERQASLEAITRTFAIISGRVGSALTKISQIQDDVSVLLERSTPNLLPKKRFPTAMRSTLKITEQNATSYGNAEYPEDHRAKRNIRIWDWIRIETEYDATFNL
ncbi:unnamed protein product [Heligmosomoides polygyrus]|uniref:Transmembrane protein n=1 Tax=Heligmosomoides polygyrus TaxID=6339 RepID=A0A183GCP6_HELPZ|nr:unnamed protein product [Heligmosomoides polygyrus]